LPATNSADFYQRRNDLQAPAQQIIPEISEILLSIANQPNCQLARMTGSGATCFGIFANPEQAEIAAYNLKTHFPNYWVRVTKLK
jgi:4-diphosphocytidyl-2-C-methyl-D-erythritol kinase